jgi:xanthosine utilization system XapX-like protein
MLGAGHFLLLLGLGVAVGLLFDHFARPSWLSPQIAGTNRIGVTSALVGVAGMFVGYQLALVIGIVGIGRPVVAILGALGVLWGWRMVR